MPKPSRLMNITPSSVSNAAWDPGSHRFVWRRRSWDDLLSIGQGRTTMKHARLALIVCMLVAGSVQAADAPGTWRDVDPNNLVSIDTKYGETAVELAPRIRAQPCRADASVGSRAFLRRVVFLSRHRRFRGAGRQQRRQSRSEMAGAEGGVHAPRGKDMVFTPLGDPDLYAPRVGHVDGFPVGRDPKYGPRVDHPLPRHLRLRARTMRMTRPPRNSTSSLAKRRAGSTAISLRSGG